MKSFEQAYKSILKKDLENLLGRKIFITNDIAYRPLEQDKTNIVAVVKTGQGTKSNVPNYDLTTLPLHITFIIEANYLQEFLGSLNLYIKDINGVANSIVLEDRDGEALNYYRVVFNTPNAYGGTFDLQTSKETFKAVMVLLTGRVVYSSNVLLDQFIPVVKINGVEYPINYLLRSEFTTQPAVDSTPIENRIVSTKKTLNIETVYNFTLLEVKDDDISKKLYNLFINDQVNFNDLYLKIDKENFIKVQSLHLSYSWDAGVGVYNLVLVR